MNRNQYYQQDPYYQQQQYYSNNPTWKDSSAPMQADVRDHLKKVYTCVLVAAFSAFLGSFVNMYISFPPIFTMIGSIVLMISLINPQQSFTTRMSLLAGFGCLSGFTLTPFLDAMAPNVLMTGLLLTSVIFGCFSLAALTAQRRTYLYMGGILGSALLGLSVLSIANIFLGSIAIFNMQLYLGLLVMSFYVAYDTQMIVEKFHMGERDYIWHSLTLFIDFVSILKHVLIILNQANDGNKRSSNKRR